MVMTSATLSALCVSKFSKVEVFQI